MAQSSYTNTHEDEEAEEDELSDPQSPFNPTDPSFPSPLFPSSHQNPNPPAAPNLLHLAFNQDSSCFSAATTLGFRIYNTDPFRELFRRDFLGDASSPSTSPDGPGEESAPSRCFSVSKSSPSLAAVPPRSTPKTRSYYGTTTSPAASGSCHSGTRLRPSDSVALLLQKIFVYNFADLKLVRQIETWANPRGLCEVSHVSR